MGLDFIAELMQRALDFGDELVMRRLRLGTRGSFDHLTKRHGPARVTEWQPTRPLSKTESAHDHARQHRRTAQLSEPGNAVLDRSPFQHRLRAVPQTAFGK